MKQCAYCGTNYFEFIQQCENCGSMEFVSLSNEIEFEDNTEEGGNPVDEKLPFHLIIFMLVFAGVIVLGLLVATGLEIKQNNSRYTNTSSPNAVNIVATVAPTPCVGYELPVDWKELELHYYPNDDLLMEQAVIFRNQK